MILDVTHSDFKSDIITLNKETDEKTIVQYAGRWGEIAHTWGVHVLRSPNLLFILKKNYSSQEAENAVISQRNHPVDIHIFHNAHATTAWPQQTPL